MSDVAYGFGPSRAYVRAIHKVCAALAMAHPCSDPNGWAWPLAQQQRHLNQCWALECDIDPMILRARHLRHQGALPQASCVEQELLPLF
ncbi:hypothetical protein [Cyanobium sp. Alchichica 3B3-8F6]|uniref:hypothetical protein n=1 Tax=Cyanobium sp. Alchichica 3B3-8F6 TaxID=2823696 RepID=UPI0028F41673|nr:hypothetical protein [Cyanobium sp. Alchichica 3B3-8F6]